ncbi:DUF134 domain-containing protein [Ethanoligenens harbinense]|uniref:UPF0251 protein Ethha_2260 n=1 Tax=Ethanoligenens harbinense (strain DSM 18485 / JCM 12961 / CGMCC 1.5033 / YUAN-3) TaxID=663278 RepID=E6U4G7_ETHHY|nr:DUF134 domain-containing protein [Ethanoligenens harbinense]ADU27774.1 protein of unknown function DUF134 [Ethanoligenens harbinense YUAN-3]AVQ96797.1 DUF134 domain-containing protein [Ethanoligenens harbinense YUAN-3]AYF39459.1 DUF134 domain-containing protein [Ethanoligenens harbinense]AYF42283.1 DUF134 domain-containing protein [Ethanoligenens harbinense]QCN93038.1 DUF134 domain-containing protein [Ethanoligenens harbinense]
MPRPKKCRRICGMPPVKSFEPVGAPLVGETVTLTVDEYEIIRWIDLEGLSQDESAERMGVARSTVQRIYDEARKKLADFIVNGKTIRIEGGDYQLCEGDLSKPCGCHKCRRQRNHNACD